MSGADEFWSYYEAKLDAEAGAIAKAKRLRKLKVHEVSLVDRGANPGARITFFKRGKAMYSKADVSDELEAYLRQLEPAMDYGAALTKRWDDERVQDLLAAHGEAPNEVIPAPVAKRDDDDGPAWRAIEKAAKALVVKSGHSITFPEAVEQALAANPRLYAWYRESAMK